MYSKSRFVCVFWRIVKARKVDRALHNVFCIVTLSIVIYVDNRGGWFFGVKSWFFHTKYPKMFCASLRSAQFFKVRPPLTWNRGSAPGQYMCIRWETDQKCSPKTLIGTVIVSVLATSAVDRGFESRSGQTMFCTHILPSSTFCWKFMI